MTEATRFTSFRDFYPYYLSEHRDRRCRLLHFIGSLGVLAWLAFIFSTGRASWWPVALLIGYGFAWVGHFVFEHNRPATFKYPLYSFVGDWVMFGQILRGQIRL